MLARQAVDERPEQNGHAGHAGAYYAQLDFDVAVFAQEDQITCLVTNIRILNRQKWIQLLFEGMGGGAEPVATYGWDSWY